MRLSVEPSVVGASRELADADVRVVAAGLDQDFRRLPFVPKRPSLGASAAA